MSVIEETDEGVLFHFHLSDNTPTEADTIELADGKKVDVVWKDVLVEGEYPMSPGPSGATSTPMKIIREGESDYAKKTIAMSDLEFAHKDGAFKYVTIPTRHEDQVLDNTGYVPAPDGVRVVEKNGKAVFQAALGFTEPDVKGKVERGTIPDVSGGFFFNHLNKHKKKKYRAAMKHVCLTPVPFMGNLDPFKPVFASDEEIEVKDVQFFEFAEGDPDSGNSGDTAEVVWDERMGLRWINNAVQSALEPEPAPEVEGRPYQPRPSYFVQDVKIDGTSGQALAEEYFKGDRTRYVIPFAVDGDAVKISPATRWVEAREAMVAASDELSTNFEELSTDTLREKLGLALGEIDANLSVDRITLDQRVSIKNATGSEFIANFAVFADGDVKVAPPEQWERTKAPEKRADTTRPVSASPKEKVTLSDDSPEAQLRAASERRRRAAGATTKKEV